MSQTRYIHPEEAFRRIDAARRIGRHVVGVEGFLNEDGGHKPLMDEILSLDPTRIPDTWSAATEFIHEAIGRKKDSRFIVYIILEDPLR